MGTRGIYGFTKGEVRKVTYNQFDSYPGRLGMKLVKFIESTTIEEMNSIFERIVLVNESDKPTKEQIEKYKEYADLSIGKGYPDDWYILLIKAQGSLEAYKEGLKHMLNADGSPVDWEYVINLDRNCLDISADWNNIKASIPLNKVNNNFMWDLQEKAYGSEGFKL